ncbi:CaiB/BaiF CoA transferase family protein [Paraburkholderia sediminicola]|uniref:CaiB/BaiF CoA transferase family protein n=1 Tax=Paraburkholderia sediminicola TaxID=458836 RepID=UPI0038B7611B
MSDAPKMSGPCSGFRVVEFGSMISAPLTGQILADMGADVIKVEPAEGDPMRNVGPFHKGMGALFMAVNRHKKSVVLNLKESADLTVARDLINSADVLVHNFRPGVIERLGLGHEELKKSNPSLIYASISGFGPSGPYVSKPAYDHVLQGMTGVMYAQGRGLEPQPIRNLLVDKSTATVTASAILGALLSRERNGGEGQRIDASLLNAFSWFGLTDNIGNFTFRTPGAQTTPPLDTHHPVPVADGWIIGHIQTDAQFVSACRLFEREDLLEDEDYRTSPQRIAKNGDMWRELGREAVKMKRGDILKRAEAVSVALGPIYTLDEFFEDPQVRNNEVFVDFEDAEFGVIRQMNFPVSFEKSTIDVRARAPLLGEHTEQVLMNLSIAT